MELLQRVRRTGIVNSKHPMEYSQTDYDQDNMVSKRGHSVKYGQTGTALGELASVVSGARSCEESCS